MLASYSGPGQGSGQWAGKRRDELRYEYGREVCSGWCALRCIAASARKQRAKKHGLMVVGQIGGHSPDVLDVQDRVLGIRPLDRRWPGAPKAGNPAADFARTESLTQPSTALLFCVWSSESAAVPWDAGLAGCLSWPAGLLNRDRGSPTEYRYGNLRGGGPSFHPLTWHHRLGQAPRGSLLFLGKRLFGEPVASATSSTASRRAQPPRWPRLSKRTACQ